MESSLNRGLYELFRNEMCTKICRGKSIMIDDRRARIELAYQNLPTEGH